MADRVDVYADNIQHQPGPNQPRLKEYSRREDTSKPGDVFVVAQAKAINARLWTFDTKVINAAPVRGVPLAAECSIGDLSGVEDVAVARRLLGLNPSEIGADGKPLPKPGGGGGGGMRGGGMHFGGGMPGGRMFTGRQVFVPGGNRFVGAPFAGQGEPVEVTEGVNPSKEVRLIRNFRKQP